jgi:hypothetical protein
VGILGSENPRLVIEQIRDSPNFNLWCRLMFSPNIGIIFFLESTVAKEKYLKMLQQFVVLQVENL